MRSMIPPLLAACVSLLLAGTALAVDGVREINQACAVDGGCVAGDAAGFPVSLAQPGSYRLTSNLDVSVAASPENTDGIEVLADGVSIDLNGFAILGVTVCTGLPPNNPLVCSPLGGGRGVDASSRNRVQLRNGTINGPGNIGVFCGDGCLIEGLIVENAGGVGIAATDSSIIRGNVVRRNGSIGIGFGGQGGLAITGNTLYQNGGHGIASGGGDSVTGNTARSNRGSGILANGGTLVQGNTTALNHEHGISTNVGCMVIDNVAWGNTQYGLSLGSNTSYGRNHLYDNAGTVTGAGASEIAPNFCQTNTTCP